MNKNRLESFSDGVIAIILTIMVLELKVPREPTLAGLGHFWPVYVAYLLSFGNVFMMWVAHHDIVAAIRTVNYALLFANGVLLFFMSLVPFALAFASETHWTQPIPVALYGVVMLAASGGFVWLRLAAGSHAQDAQVLAYQRVQATTTLVLGSAFLGGSVAAFYAPRAALFLYALVPLFRVGQIYSRGRAGA
ncbi:MAG TPA: TMEM175 family protein [Burkholderiales bacterium]|nr:TMEM175 family protein [Burkholderiales bacterium]